MIRKITYGFVVQCFDDDGNCIDQEFVAGDQVEYEKDEELIDPDDLDIDLYFPLDMGQPSQGLIG